MDGFKIFFESTTAELHQSTVLAYPRTGKRQHSIDPIKITQMEWIPYLGLKTLYVKGLAQSDSGKQYSPMIMFKNVNFHTSADGYNLIEIVASDNQPYYLERLQSNGNDVTVRCNCADLYWRGIHYLKQDNSLYGRDRKPYIGQGLWEANPSKSPILCKHLIKFVNALKDAGALI